MESEITTIMDPAFIITILIPLLVIALCLTIFLLMWYSGFFLEIDVKTCKSPLKELEVAYKFVKGSHKDSGNVYAEAHSLIPHLRCMGIYYDDPKEDENLESPNKKSARCSNISFLAEFLFRDSKFSLVSEDCMRSIVGLILNDEDRTVSEEDRQRITAKGFQIAKFPEVEYVVYSAFPHNSFLSVLIAIHKLLPRFRDYIKERKLEAYPLLEVCDGLQIIYLAPLSNQSEFFVYEALAESEEEVTSDKTLDEPEEISVKDLEDFPDTLSSVDSLMESGSKVEDLPSNEAVLDSLEQKNKTGGNNSSEASTESFEELQLDS